MLMDLYCESAPDCVYNMEINSVEDIKQLAANVSGGVLPKLNLETRTMVFPAGEFHGAFMDVMVQCGFATISERAKAKPLVIKLGDR